jgi:phosphohistidine phosphatase SixA
MRHGEAETFGESGDSSRNLTQSGIPRIKAQLELLQLPANTVLVSSFYNRAIQTADLVQEKFKMQERFDVDFLTPSSSANTAIAKLQELNADNLFITSHLPLVHLIMNNLGKTYVPFAFNTASIVHLEGDLQTGQMEIVKTYA